MIAGSQPTQRPPDAKLLVVDASGRISHAPRSAFTKFLRPRDLVIANDAATLPASLHGVHLPTGSPIEVRLAGRRSLAVDDVREFLAIIFGAGDFHTRTEDRPAPPRMAAGDRLALGPLSATIKQLLGHPRLVSLRFEGSPDAIWGGLARHGRPIQYAHVPLPLEFWDVWTPIAGPPVAFEPPSAGFALGWQELAEIRAQGVDFATITHAAGISSTGDAELDLRLPFEESYRVPETTVSAIRRAKERGVRVIAIGTTTVRALEHAGREGPLRAGIGLATQRIGADSRLQVVEAILTGIHEPGTSHYELLRAFLDDATLRRVTAELDAGAYRTHEFGDSVLIERMVRQATNATPSFGQQSKSGTRNADGCRKRPESVSRADSTANSGAIGHVDFARGPANPSEGRDSPGELVSARIESAHCVFARAGSGRMFAYSSGIGCVRVRSSTAQKRRTEWSLPNASAKVNGPC